MVARLVLASAVLLSACKYTPARLCGDCAIPGDNTTDQYTGSGDRAAGDWKLGDHRTGEGGPGDSNPSDAPSIGDPGDAINPGDPTPGDPTSGDPLHSGDSLQGPGDSISPGDPHHLGDPVGWSGWQTIADPKNCTNGSLRSVQLTGTSSALVAGYSGQTGVICDWSDESWHRGEDLNLPIYDIFFFDDLVGVAALDTGWMCRTVDRATSWLPCVHPYTDDFFAVHFGAADTGLAVGQWTGVATSNDLGENWSALDAGSTDIHHYGAWVGNTAAWVVGVYHGGSGSGSIRKLTLDGMTWDDKTHSAALWDVQFPVDDETGIAVGAEGTVLQTINGGSSWTQIAAVSGGETLYAMSFPNGTQIGWVVGESGAIYRTDDGGTTWVDQHSGTSNDLRDVSFFNHNVGIAVGDAGTVLMTRNGGL